MWAWKEMTSVHVPCLRSHICQGIHHPVNLFHSDFIVMRLVARRSVLSRVILELYLFALESPKQLNLDYYRVELLPTLDIIYFIIVWVLSDPRKLVTDNRLWAHRSKPGEQRIINLYSYNQVHYNKPYTVFVLLFFKVLFRPSFIASTGLSWHQTRNPLLRVSLFLHQQTTRYGFNPSRVFYVKKGSSKP